MIHIFLEKYSDCLEAYNVVVDYSNHDIMCHFIENERNDERSIKGFFLSYTNETQKVDFFSFNSREIFLNTFCNYVKKIKNNDILVAPFVRYKELWLINNKYRKNIISIHLSECLPDSFGHLGYRIAYRGKLLKTWLTLPFAKIYAITHKPDICYFPLYPFIENTFVKKTLQVQIPPLMDSKRIKLIEFTSGKKRTLLIGGFGYNVTRMAKYLGLNEYIATSKGKEIIVDGITIPLEERICAEEVLLSGCVSRIVGYPSSAMVWAKIIDDKINIECYESSELNRIYSPFYNYFAKIKLKKIGIKVLPECKEMLLCH